jgi:hypothetical protein
MRRYVLAMMCVSVAMISVAADAAIGANGASTTPYTAAYVNGPTGYFQCSGVRIIKTGPNAVVKDSETCDVTVGEFVVPDGTTRLGLNPPLHTWYSDYEYFVNPGGCLNPSISGTITVKSKSPGKQTWTIVAYYDPSFVCAS